jgi:hypothetical protein
LNDGFSAFNPQSVGWWRSIFEHRIVGQELRQRVHVVPVERFIESVNDRSRIFGGRR